MGARFFIAATAPISTGSRKSASATISISRCLPIGAYDAPTGREVHMNPEEAVQAFLELGAKNLVPMHYGSFRLGYEPLDEPPARLLAAASAHGIEDKVLVMTEGSAGRALSENVTGERE